MDNQQIKELAQNIISDTASLQLAIMTPNSRVGEHDWVYTLVSELEGVKSTARQLLGLGGSKGLSPEQALRLGCQNSLNRLALEIKRVTGKQGGITETDIQQIAAVIDNTSARLRPIWLAIKDAPMMTANQG